MGRSDGVNDVSIFLEEEIEWPEERRDDDEVDNSYFDNYEENDPHPYNESPNDEMTPESISRLKELMSTPLEAGVDGQNASAAIADFINDEELFDMIYEIANTSGPETDVRALVNDFLVQAGINLQESTIKKATYSDYQSAYRSNSVGGTDNDRDAKDMVSILTKQGKEADIKTANNMLKRMAETSKVDGLTLKESMIRLQRDAGIIK